MTFQFKIINAKCKIYAPARADLKSDRLEYKHLQCDFPDYKS